VQLLHREVQGANETPRVAARLGEAFGVMQEFGAPLQFTEPGER